MSDCGLCFDVYVGSIKLPTRGHEGTPRIAYVDKEFGVRRPIPIGGCCETRSLDRVEHVRTLIASEIGSFEHPRFLRLELATTTRHSTHKLVSFRALVQLRLPEQGHEVTMEYIACIRDTWKQGQGWTAATTTFKDFVLREDSEGT